MPQTNDGAFVLARTLAAVIYALFMLGARAACGRKCFVPALCVCGGVRCEVIWYKLNDLVYRCADRLDEWAFK